MITMKCSLHLGHKHSRAHNVRKFDKEKWNKDGHINPDRAHLNSVLVDTDYLKFIDENFGDALVDFNEKNYQKHPDRLIGFNSKAAYEKCSDKERRSKAVKAYAREHKKDVQEAIIQLGDHGEYLEMVKLHGKTEADKIYALYLEEAFEKWQKDNPTLKVFCAAIHMDEVSDGTPHLHIDFMPVVESTRGLNTKVSMDSALDKLGFKREKEHKYSETPYKLWLKDRRAAFEDFAQGFVNEHKLEIVILPSEPCKVGHIDPPEYKARQSRVKASKGAIAAFTGKDKKLQVEAAEFIISNAQVVADGIAAEATAERKVAVEKKAEADKMIEAAKVAQESYQQAQREADEQKEAAVNEKNAATAERTVLADKAKALDKSVNQQVRRRLQTEKLHRDMSKTSAAQQRRMKQIGVTLDENGLTVSKER